MSKTRILHVGLDPSLIDFSDPAYGASPDMNAEKLLSALQADHASLNALGYEVAFCLVDFGETAEAVLRERLARDRVDAILIGAGVRLVAKNTPLFETLVNVAHECAPRAKFCFNTNPRDSAEAVKRWFPTP